MFITFYLGFIYVLRRLKSVIFHMCMNTSSVVVMYRVSQKKVWLAAPAAKLFIFVQLSCMVFFQYLYNIQYRQFIHIFAFYKLLILREGRFADFVLGHWNRKKLKIFKNYWKIIIEKNTIQESCTKKVQFCTRRR